MKSVSSSFSKDLSHKAKTKDFKIVLEDCSNAPENTGSDGTVSAGDQSDICCSADVNDEDDGSKTNDTNKNDEACLFECVGDNDSATSLPCPLCQFNWHSGKSCYSLC